MVRKWIVSLVVTLLLCTSVVLHAQDASTSGNLAGSGQALALELDGYGTAAIQVTGTWAGTLLFEATVDGTNWFGINVFRVSDFLAVTSSTSNGEWMTGVAGYQSIRVRAFPYTSGTAVANIRAAQQSQPIPVSVSTPAPPSTVTITNDPLDVNVLTMPAGGSGLTDAELRASPVPVMNGTTGVQTDSFTPGTPGANAEFLGLTGYSSAFFTMTATGGTSGNLAPFIVTDTGVHRDWNVLVMTSSTANTFTMPWLFSVTSGGTATGMINLPPGATGFGFREATGGAGAGTVSVRMVPSNSPAPYMNGTTLFGADATLDSTIGQITAFQQEPTSTARALSVRQVGMPAAAALADNVANPTLTKIQNFTMVWDSAGSNWDRWTGAVTGAVSLSAALPAGTNSIGDIGTVTNVAQLGGQAVAMGTGVRTAGTQRVTVATDDVVAVTNSGTFTVATGLPTDTSNTTQPSPLVVNLVGGGDHVNDRSYQLPVMGNNWDRPGINHYAVSTVIRNGMEQDGSVKSLNDFLSVGGVANTGTLTAKKLMFSSDQLSADPDNKAALVVREYGQGYTSSGNISVAGTRITISHRYVVKTASLFNIENLSFVGTLRPVVSYDNGTSWSYVSSFNTLTNAVASSYVDADASGTFVVPWCNGSTNCGFEITARTSGSLTFRVSGNSQGMNGIFASVAGTVSITNTDIDIRDLAFATDKVDASGSTVAISGTVPVSAAALPLPAGAATAALQTQPGVDIGDVTVNNAAGAAAVNIQDGGNSITVDGPLTDVQARATPLPVSGTVAITAAALPLPAGAATAALQTQPGVDIGDVTVNNAAGAAAVNVQDGGNSLTVDVGTALPAGTNNIGDVDVITLPAITGTVTANLAAGTNNIGDVDVLTLPALPAGGNNIGDVDVLTLPSVTIGTFPDNEPFNVAQINGVAPLMGNGASGTGAQRVTLASDSTGVLASVGSITNALPVGNNNIGDVDVVSNIPGTGATNLGKAEDAAHTSGDVGVAILAVRKETTTLSTDADGDHSDVSVDGYGVQYTRSGDHPTRYLCTMTSTAVTSTVITGCIGNGGTTAVSPGAGLARYVTSVQFYNSIAGTVANPFTLQYGTGATCATGITVVWRAINEGINTGVSVAFTPPLRLGTATDLCFLQAGAGTRLVNIQGFIAP